MGKRTHLPSSSHLSCHTLSRTVCDSNSFTLDRNTPNSFHVKPTWPHWYYIQDTLISPTAPLKVLSLLPPYFRHTLLPLTEHAQQETSTPLLPFLLPHPLTSTPFLTHFLVYYFSSHSFSSPIPSLPFSFLFAYRLSGLLGQLWWQGTGTKEGPPPGVGGRA